AALLLRRQGAAGRRAGGRADAARVRRGPRARGGGRRRRRRHRGRVRVRRDRSDEGPSVVAPAVGTRSVVRRRRAARPAGDPHRARDHAHHRRPLRRRAGARRNERRPRPAPADDLAGRPDPAAGGRRADLAHAVRRRRPRPGRRAQPRHCAARSRPRTEGARSMSKTVLIKVMPRECSIALVLLGALLLAGCRDHAPQALGTLEYDRVTLPAPVAERIVSIDVREGQRVEAGATLLTLETTRTEAQAQAAQAQAQRQREALAELEAGPRDEDIAQARASLAAAQAQARDASAYYARLQPLGKRQLVAAAEVDRARAAAGNAQAQVRAAQAALDELLHGTREEQLAQGE